MFQHFLTLALVLVLIGCASSRVSKQHPAFSKSLAAQQAGTPAAPTDAPLLPQESPESTAVNMVFAKTAFEGVTKTSYIEFMLTNLAEPGKTYELIIGDKASQSGLPWKMKTVEPGYFFIELPVGDYRIRSIAIPVGTTQAVEPIDITFTVHPDEATYLGTLMIIGTKEKIKLGGIPVIRPGFEYKAGILDQHEEAVRELKKNYPDLSMPIKVQLMRINSIPPADGQSPS